MALLNRLAFSDRLTYMKDLHIKMTGIELRTIYLKLNSEHLKTKKLLGNFQFFLGHAVGDDYP